MNGWVSPRLGIRFQLTENNLEIYRPDGQRFLTSVELAQNAEQERQEKELAQTQAEQQRQLAEQQRQRAEEAIAQLEQEQQRYQALLEQLHRSGIDPGNIPNL
jgi:DNA-binding protein H-NS